MQADCELWTGAVNSKGYGIVWTHRDGVRRTVTASRWTWEQANGRAPSDMDVSHACDTPLCVNINHLRLLTHHANLLEMVARGRHRNQSKTKCVTHGIEYDMVWMNRGKPGRRCSSCIAAKRAKAKIKRAKALGAEDMLPEDWRK